MSEIEAVEALLSPTPEPINSQEKDEPDFLNPSHENGPESSNEKDAVVQTSTTSEHRNAHFTECLVSSFEMHKLLVHEKRKPMVECIIQVNSSTLYYS